VRLRGPRLSVGLRGPRISGPRLSFGGSRRRRHHGRRTTTSARRHSARPRPLPQPVPVRQTTDSVAGLLPHGSMLLAAMRSAGRGSSWQRWLQFALLALLAVPIWFVQYAFTTPFGALLYITATDRSRLRMRLVVACGFGLLISAYCYLDDRVPRILLTPWGLRSPTV
jgi:hypothetical protein